MLDRTAPPKIREHVSAEFLVIHVRTAGQQTISIRSERYDGARARNLHCCPLGVPARRGAGWVAD